MAGKDMARGDVIGTDVLCVGGGIAGLMAAIRACDLGAKVIVAEKGNTWSRGSGGMGNPVSIWYVVSTGGPERC